MQTVFMSLSDEEVHRINKAMEREDSRAREGRHKAGHTAVAETRSFVMIHLCVCVEREMESEIGGKNNAGNDRLVVKEDDH